MNTRHHASVALVPAPQSEVFAFLDEHALLASHMGKRSLAMGGGSMFIEFDAARGKAVGSRLTLSGRAFGMRLHVAEEVTERLPPLRKTWRTIGEPTLLVIGRYQMGFAVEDLGQKSRLTVFIDYDRPRQAPERWLGWPLGRAYAKWCTRRMAGDAAKHFERP